MARKRFNRIKQLFNKAAERINNVVNTVLQRIDIKPQVKSTKDFTQRQTKKQARKQINRTNKRSSEIKRSTQEDNDRINKMVKSYFEQGNKTTSQKANKEPRTSRQKLIRSQANFFYGATKNLWFAGSETLRDENILYGMRNFKLESGKRVENLQDAIQWVMEQFPGKFPTDSNGNVFVSDTFEDAVFGEESEPEDDSPPTISLQAFRQAGWMS